MVYKEKCTFMSMSIYPNGAVKSNEKFSVEIKLKTSDYILVPHQIPNFHLKTNQTNNYTLIKL